MTFVVTGVLDYVEKEEVKEKVEQLGGKVTTGVTKKTSYLVTGRDPGPAKIQKVGEDCWLVCLCDFSVCPHV